jgi:hypothetical protein
LFCSNKVFFVSLKPGPAVPLDAMEAAAAVFPSLARPLQKYLRVTRQQPWHTAESVLNHLATCLRLGLAPRAFLDRYLSYQPVLQVSIYLTKFGLPFFWKSQVSEVSEGDDGMCMIVTLHGPSLPVEMFQSGTVSCSCHKM